MSNLGIGGHKFPSQLAGVIWTAISSLQEDEYMNGRSAAYWHVMATLDQHLVREHNSSIESTGEDDG